jgi:hypothetical protein
MSPASSTWLHAHCQRQESTKFVIGSQGSEISRSQGDAHLVDEKGQPVRRYQALRLL